jgi:O-antigen/teichoic acid export membrane protein
VKNWKINDLSITNLGPLIKFRRIFTEGHERSIKAKKNIIALIFLKGGYIAISLLLVPMTINYISASGYGIWLTLSSIVAWFSFFDIGLGQGLRNKLAEAQTKNDYEIARVYVSTTYAILTIIFVILWLLFLIINPHIDWTKVLNVNESMSSDVMALSLIVFTYFCFSSVLKLITTILTADQRPAKASLIDLFGVFLSLLAVFILKKTTEASLLKLGIALCGFPFLVLLTANIILFNGPYRKFRPSFSKIKFSDAKNLVNLGLVFFVIQIAAIIQFQTANIIIAKNFGSTEVTSYNIVYKYFGALNMIFMIFITPFWSASTEAFLKKDIAWIKNGIRKYNQLNIILLIISILMLVYSKVVYNLWIGKGTVNIIFSLSFWGFLYYNVMMFGSKYVAFLNGISALRIQFVSSLFTPVLYILLVIVFIKHFKMGLESVFIASILSNFNGIILAPLQYYKIVYQNKKGIWIK